MIYAAAAAAGALALLMSAPGAHAQTWGQPVYFNVGGRPVGGTPMSEVDTRAYVETGRWADGYSERPYVHVPGSSYGVGRYGHGYRERLHAERYRSGDRVGYRDEWGYQDDRPPSTVGRRADRRGDRRQGDCGCADVYLYDR